jgi:putative flippase GtrA
MGRISELVKRFPKFVGVNAIGTIIDTAVLWLFSHFVFDGYVGEYVISPVISFECAVMSNYLFSYFGVWRERRSAGSFVLKYIMYNISSSLVFTMKLGVILLLERLFGWNVVICNLAALCLSGLINFSLSEWVIFRKKQV